MTPFESEELASIVEETEGLKKMPITLQSWLDRSSLRPNGESKVSAVFEIVAKGTRVEGERQPARTILALDVSLSMRGQPLTQVIKSVDRLLDAVAEDDEIGVVAFSGGASRVVDPVKMDAAGKRLVRQRVHRLTADRGTNIEKGLTESAAMLADTPAGRRRGVVLLSDGEPNVGAHTVDALKEVVRNHKQQQAIAFFSLGYGAGHSEDILSAVGDGGYEYVADPATCARAFARALGTQADVVATEIELVLAPAAGVELVRFVGKETTRFSRAGVVVSLPDMVDAARRIVVAELRLADPGAKFLLNLLDGTAKCKGEAAQKVDATIEITDRASVPVVEALRRILLARAEESREEARMLADRQQFSSAATTLRRIMAEITALPGWVANDGSQLGEAYELLVDEVMVYERVPDPEQYAMYRKSMTGERLGTITPHAKNRGGESSKLIMHVAGDCPVAWLLNQVGARYNLHEECVIGRTQDADIVVMSPSVSRRHAEVFANAGDFWVADMGSTNPTIVNGKALHRAPHKLLPGDVIKVGDMELTYQEAPRKID